jgi:hypothetical protein
LFIEQFNALPKIKPLYKASWLRVGRAPGCHVQTGHIFVFGFVFSKSCWFLHWQKSLFSDFNFR